MILKSLVIYLSLFFVPSLSFADTAKFDSQMAKVLTPYLAIQDALTKDSMEKIESLATSIVAAADKLDPVSVSGEHKMHFKDIPANLKKSAGELATLKDIASAREVFKKLSQPMAMWVGMSKPSGVEVAFCPMAKASWIQNSGTIKNPYYGSKMLTCGEFIK